MRSVLGFLLLAGLAVAASAGLSLTSPADGGLTRVDLVAGARALDPDSLLTGVLLGLGLAMVAGVPWSTLPGRAAAWLAARERAFYRLVWAGLFLAILLFY